jgi:hypothetical protein
LFLAGIFSHKDSGGVCKKKTPRNPSHREKQCLIKIKRKVKAMIAKINQSNETLALHLTKAFGTMWICYAFMVYGVLPAFAIFHPYQESFLYWSNWVQLWSLPLILVGTNILGRDAEKRSQLDHEKLAKSYEEQQRTYKQVIAMLTKQEEMMTAMLQQDKVLEAQNIVLAEQTEVLAEQTEILKTPKRNTHSVP